MKRNKHAHRKGVDESEENLRGRLRELQKELDKERRYSRSLEKRLYPKKDSKEKTEDVVPTPQEGICPNCGKGTMVEQVIHSPTKEIVWAVCNYEACKHRERRK